jgi:hypothetical protein
MNVVTLPGAMKACRLLIPILALTLGCATRPYGSVSGISTRPEGAKTRILEANVEGEHCRSGLLVLVDKIEDYKMAVQDAISSVEGADALVDASVDYVLYDFFFYQKWCIRVSGSAAVFE